MEVYTIHKQQANGPEGPERWERLAVGGALLAGIVVRLLSAMVVGRHFPFHLGGLFYAFADEIAANGFALPATIPFYSEGGIPFAYPPLAFYVQALLGVAGLPMVARVNLLPPLLGVLALLLMVPLARRLLPTATARVAAVAAYALMPNAFRQQIEAAGLAEGMGALALMLLALAWTGGARAPTRARLAPVGAAAGLCLLSSPGSAYGALLLCGGMALWLWRDSEGSRRALVGGLVAMGAAAALVAAPYLLAVWHHHGPTLLLAALAGQHAPRVVAAEWGQQFLGWSLAGQPDFLWNALLAAGVLVALARRRWPLLGALFLLAAIPREGSWLAALPAALLVGEGSAVVGPRLRSALRGVGRGSRWAVALALALMALWGPAMTLRAAITEQAYRFTASEWQGLPAVAAATPPEARLVVLASPQVVEWLPVMARRTVLNQPYGSEWEPQTAPALRALDGQLWRCARVGCLAEVARQAAPPDAPLFLLLSQSRYEVLREPADDARIRWRNGALVLLGVEP